MKLEEALQKLGPIHADESDEQLRAIVDRHGKARPQHEDGIVSGILLSRADRKSATAGQSEVRP